MHTSQETMYFDTSTGRLIIRSSYKPSQDKLLMTNMSKDGFCGAQPLLEASLQWSSQEFINEVKCLSPDKDGTRAFYKIQSLQCLGERGDQHSVPIWIARSVAKGWIKHIRGAMNDINYAAPGLCLYTTSDESKARVKIFGSGDGCYTLGNILKYGPDFTVEIHLSDDWKEKKRTSCHELLHALGFGHEHQRQDRDSSVHVQDVKGEWKLQYCKKSDLYGVTRFDPFSIMMYPEEQECLRRNSKDPVWVTKPTTEINIEMSELDKVSLNNLYRPCKGPNYSPAAGESFTGLLYCKRYFGVQTPDHDGYCGPNNGPNCPACRVLRSDKVVSLWKKGKWQGWTGAVYCSRKFGVQEEGHDGFCGPDNGPSCPECDIELSAILLSWIYIKIIL